MNDNLQFTKLPFSVKTAFFIIAFLVLFTFSIIEAKGLLIPFTYSVLISFILYPLCKFFEKKGIPRTFSILLCFFIVVAGLFGLFYFFSTQVVSIVSEFEDFRGKLLNLVHQGIEQYNKIVPNSKLDDESLFNQSKEWLSSSGTSFLSGTLNQTSNFFSGLILVPIYVFLLLLYRTGIRKVLLRFVHHDYRVAFTHLLTDVQQVGQKYIGGLITIIFIIGILDSVALWIIGVDSPFFFGFLAACLAIIPYIGTGIGALLPALYALMNHSPTTALYVLIAFWAVQFLEGNFLTPKIIGGEVSLNPLAAILSLVAGGFVWGLSGMVLFIPLAAIMKIVCQNYTELEPIAGLMGDEITQGNDIVRGKNHEPRKPFWKKLLK
ncbi:putative permease [Bernardetia litoralis DSM 6794]|uniref:Putative permease n=1 Tax=Bernardetia litoralis (strain ATCC 23117 / DSM 6794 / NBRC 15988 / NCIMB 1366 / Fx l1 / Sio-4) TaxID=880071 RepID=I4AHJ8_BERLS|nr:AI-2E family transporter [Bernardetia litoralis]AFM03433.1 putative permease [Bernardetia litoralis DSM 6794]